MSVLELSFARVSTEYQRLTFQLDALKQVGCPRIFREMTSELIVTDPN